MGLNFKPSWAILVTFSSGAVGHSPIHWSRRGHHSGTLQALAADVSSRIPFIDPETTGSEAPALLLWNNESKTLSSHKSWLDMGHEADF